tara:strand:- start:1702 stop:2874 length:1173 start_codon:yes stop_codon:yes gene_type:complete
MQTLLLIILVIAISSIIYVLYKPQKSETKKVFNAEYFRGLNYLLNNEEDKAFKVFTALMDVDSSTVETHLALGGLYRRRGEFDKAILIHQNLLSRPTLESELKQQALYELAKDFFSAGLYDRSEKIFRTLSENKIYRQSSLEYLLRVYEMIKDWDKAIELAKIIDTESFNDKPINVLLAQYYCEMSEMYLHDEQIDKALSVSKKALKINKSCIRANIQLGDYYSKNNINMSIQYYIAVLNQNPIFASYAIKKILYSAQSLDNDGFLKETFQKILENKELGFLPDIYQYLYHHVSPEEAFNYTERFKSINNTNNFQVGYSLLCTAISHAEEKDLLNKIKNSYDEIINNQMDFICKKCGYKSNTLNWSCPSCNSWETIVPNQLTDILDKIAN